MSERLKSIRKLSGKSWFLLILALCVGYGFVPESHAARSDVRFRVTVDKTTLQRQDLLQMTVTISTQHSSFRSLRLPRHRRFRLLRRKRARRTDVVYLSGGRTAFRYVWTYTLLWRPRRLGTFTFSPGKLRVGRETYTTKPITVTVLRALVSQKQPATELPAIIQPTGSTFLLPVLSPKTVTLGQQATLSYYLFTRYNETITRTQPPPLLQFEQETLHALQMIQSQRQITLQGKVYRYALALRHALFARKTGVLSVEPMSIWINRDASDARQQERIQSPKVSLRVLPLPSRGRPADWQEDRVGQYTMTSQLPQQTYTLPTPIPWTQCIQGVGNLRQLTFPTLQLPQGLKRRYQRRQTWLKKSRKQVRGRTCRVVYLRATRPATYQLPGLRLPYYDPWQQRYLTATAGPLSFKVVGVPRLGQVDTPQGIAGKPLPAARGNKTSSPGQKTPGSPLLWFGAGGGFLCLLMMGWMLRRRRGFPTVEVEEEEPAYPASQDRLEALQAWLHRARPEVGATDLKELESLLYQWFDAYLQKPTRALPLDTLVRELGQRGMSAAVCTNLRELLQHCHQLRFAPSLTAQSAAHVVDTLRQVLPHLH